MVVAVVVVVVVVVVCCCFLVFRVGSSVLCSSTRRAPRVTKSKGPKHTTETQNNTTQHNTT